MLLASSPSLVMSRSPSLSLSRRPTQKSLCAAYSGGISWNTVCALCGSRLVQTYPRGLFIIKTMRERVSRTIFFPLRRTSSSPGTTVCPSSAISPLTVISPLAMSVSAARREQTSACDKYFCSRIRSFGASIRNQKSFENPKSERSRGQTRIRRFPGELAC